MNEKDFIKLDVETIELVELSTIEKKKIEKHILHTSKQKTYNKFKWVSAIAMTACIIASSTLWLPAVASQIPIVQQFLQLNDEPQLQVFNEYATIINQVDESNGSTIELAEAFFDGQIITISYKVQHKQAITEVPNFWRGTIQINKQPVDVQSHQIVQKDADTWIGMFTARVATNQVLDETVTVEWAPTEFRSMESTILAEGDWYYQVKLVPTQAFSKELNMPFGNEQYALRYTQITQGKYVTTLYFEGNLDWDTEMLMLEITDNLGNSYENVGVTTFKNELGEVNGYAEFLMNHPTVKSLTIVPQIRVVDSFTLEKKALISLSTDEILLH